MWFTPTRGASNWLWLSFFIILFDQITKAMVTRSLDLYESIELLPVLKLTHQLNRGAAFSILANAGGWQRWFFIGLALIISAVLMVWLRRIRTPGQTILAIGLALVLGGALGNVIDRVWLGHVVDFVAVHWGDAYFPSFNVADSAISVGAGCLLIDAFLESGREKAREKSKRENSTG
ncbi:MAG: signal peptidase II [Candidatus Obscuribacterales bacterium]|nr:signal peptidase II [Steroidobacteraceae bacterium]